MLATVWLGASIEGSGVASPPIRSVPLCAGVVLSASYLAVVGDGSEGFHFKLSNRTNREVRLVKPVPSSAHWYARSHGRWLWRASNGAGGSLLHAGDEHGRVVVYPAVPGPDVKYLTVRPHRSFEWNETQRENPVLAYQPGCAQCSYPGEREYRVVFAYAYSGGQRNAGLLSCGLRSAPVPMPPKP